MILTPDFAGLFKVLKSTENALNFDFSEFCGTKCCAIGNFCRDNPGDDLHITGDSSMNFIRFGSSFSAFASIAKRFNITKAESLWLFNNGTDNETFIDTSLYNQYEVGARLRKFIYYKMHKADILLDPKWGIKQAARRTGHINIAKKVKESCQKLLTI